MPTIDEHSTTAAADPRALLARGRATVLLAGPDANGRYMAHLLGARAVRGAYVGAGVTEIASRASAEMAMSYR